MTCSPSEPYFVVERSQLELLASPLRHEILSAVSALGNCSARQIASELGVAQNALYYHLRKLVKGGLLLACGTRNVPRRAEELYRTPGEPMEIAHDPSDGHASDLMGKAVAAFLRAADRDFFRACGSDVAVTAGTRRNLGGGRLTGWLSPEEVGELNEHLARVERIVRSSRRREESAERRLQSFTWLLAPLESKR